MTPVAPAYLSDFFSEVPEGPDPAGVSGGEANAESLGLPWGDCQFDELGVGTLVEPGVSSSREGT